jgi:hypothetical protein
VVVVEQVVAVADKAAAPVVPLFISPEVYSRASPVATTTAVAVLVEVAVEDSGAELPMDIALVVIPDATEADMVAVDSVPAVMVEKDLPCNSLMVLVMAAPVHLAQLDIPIQVQQVEEEEEVVAAAITADVMAVAVVMDRAILAAIRAEQELPT